MLTVIGLGAAGCNVAELFESNSLFNVKLIDSNIEGENCYSLNVYNSPEDYENNTPDMNEFLKDCSDDILFILAGSGTVTGATLRILEKLKNKNINILYIRPDIELLNNIGKMQERLTFNVLQQYARSGMFERIYLVNNLDLESIIGEPPVIGYYESLNKLLYTIFSSVYILDKKPAIIENSSLPEAYSRISTIGIYDIDKNIEKMLYNFDYTDDKCYYFVINENTLKSDGKLFKTIKDNMKQKILNNLKISYKIYSTQQQTNYCYVVCHTRKIQE